MDAEIRHKTEDNMKTERVLKPLTRQEMPEAVQSPLTEEPTRDT